MGNITIYGVTYSSDEGLYLEQLPTGNYKASLQTHFKLYAKEGASRDMAIINLARDLREYTPDIYHYYKTHFSNYYKPRG